MPSNGPNLISPNAKNKTEITFESLKEDLDCPVCYDVPESLPIYQCTQGHIICNSCYPKLNNCPVCRVILKSLFSPQIRALTVEKILQKHRDVPYNQSISSDQGQRRRQAGQPGQSAGHEQPAEHGFDIFFCLFVTAIFAIVVLPIISVAAMFSISWYFGLKMVWYCGAPLH